MTFIQPTLMSLSWCGLTALLLVNQIRQVKSMVQVTQMRVIKGNNIKINVRIGLLFLASSFSKQIEQILNARKLKIELIATTVKEQMTPPVRMYDEPLRSCSLDLQLPALFILAYDTLLYLQKKSLVRFGGIRSGQSGNSVYHSLKKQW